jgi:predicted Fe-Mo cluster-binding NifX family protein
MSFEALPNENLAQGSGVGIQSAKLVADRGAKAVLTGNIGPKAQDVLVEVGVDVITGISGTVRETAQQYRDGELQPKNEPVQADAKQSEMPNARQTANPRPGMGRGTGMGRGMGMGGGRGMRCGCGKRGGRGMGMGSGMAPTLSDQTAMTSRGQMAGEDELARLKGNARMLREEMREMERRIKEIEDENA